MSACGGSSFKNLPWMFWPLTCVTSISSDELQCKLGSDTEAGPTPRLGDGVQGSRVSFLRRPIP